MAERYRFYHPFPGAFVLAVLNHRLELIRVGAHEAERPHRAEILVAREESDIHWQSTAMTWNCWDLSKHATPRDSRLDRLVHTRRPPGCELDRIEVGNATCGPRPTNFLDSLRSGLFVDLVFDSSFKIPSPSVFRLFSSVSSAPVPKAVVPSISIGSSDISSAAIFTSPASA